MSARIQTLWFNKAGKMAATLACALEKTSLECRQREYRMSCSRLDKGHGIFLGQFNFTFRLLAQQKTVSWRLFFRSRAAARIRK